MTIAEHEQLVSALLEVDGIAAASVEPDQDARTPGALRLRLAAGADEQAVANEVSRVLRTTFRLGVAEQSRPSEPQSEPRPAAQHEAPPLRSVPPLRPVPPLGVQQSPVGLSQDSALARRAGPSESQVATATADADRLLLGRVQMVSRGLDIVSTVDLQCDGRVFTGSAEGAKAASSMHRSVAIATLRAVEHACENKARFDVDYVEVIPTGSEQTVLVLVSMVTDRGAERYSGSSIVRDDVGQAVIRSVLAAVNRRVDGLMDLA